MIFTCWLACQYQACWLPNFIHKLTMISSFIRLKRYLVIRLTSRIITNIHQLTSWDTDSCIFPFMNFIQISNVGQNEWIKLLIFRSKGQSLHGSYVMMKLEVLNLVKESTLVYLKCMAATLIIKQSSSNLVLSISGAMYSFISSYWRLVNRWKQWPACTLLKEISSMYM